MENAPTFVEAFSMAALEVDDWNRIFEEIKRWSSMRGINNPLIGKRSEIRTT